MNQIYSRTVMQPVPNTQCTNLKHQRKQATVDWTRAKRGWDNDLENAASRLKRTNIENYYTEQKDIMDA